MNTRYCPFCNHEMDRHPSPYAPCTYRGLGQTKQQREQAAEGYQLGALEPGNSHHNGAGCYDADGDFA